MVSGQRIEVDWTGTLSGRTMPPRTTVKLPALRYWRVQRALKQSELATLAHMHENSIQRLERGRPAEMETIRRLAEVLEVEPADLMREPPES